VTPALGYLAVSSIHRGVLLTQKASRRNRIFIVFMGQINLAFVLGVSLYIILGETSLSFVIYLVTMSVALMYTLCALGAVRSAIRLLSTRVHVSQPSDWDMLSDKMALLEFYRIWASSLGGLTVKITGIGPLRERHEALCSHQPLAKKIVLSDNGAFNTSDIAQQLDQITEDEIKSLFTPPINMMFKVCRAVFGERLLEEVRVMGSKVPLHHRVLEEREEILTSLFGGLLVDRAVTGTEVDRKIRGGFPVGSSVLLLADPGVKREQFVTDFLETAMEAGYGAIYVSALNSPQDIQARFPDQLSLRVVDYYSGLVKEVKGYSHREKVFTCPNLAVLPHAIREAVDDLGPEAEGGRALVDLLPSYLSVQEVGEVWVNLARIVDKLKQSRMTSIFTLDPTLLKAEKRGTLEEIFDNVISLIDRGGPTPGVRIQKMSHSKSYFARFLPGTESKLTDGDPVFSPRLPGQIPHDTASALAVSLIDG
jgi:KaiC/GvpD/RAD55 family RecA-like ATPase